MSALASRLGGYVQAYTLYSSVRPFGVSAILGGWDSEAPSGVDGQVGSGPSTGPGGKAGDQQEKRGGPGLYMIEPSGLYWVSARSSLFALRLTSFRATMAQLLARADKPQKQNSRNLTLHPQPHRLP